MSTTSLSLAPPYLLFLGAARDPLAAKMALACARFRPEACVGQLRLEGCAADAGLPDMDPEEAVRRGARSLVIGVVSPGGRLSPDWTQVILRALEAGLDVVSGMHQRVDSVPEIGDAAIRLGRRIVELRHERPPLATATGRPRSGKRLLTVGTDCSCGKMFTALSIEREMRARGMDADFRATGQTGMLIAGGGIAVDAVVADFISGAAEALSPDAPPEHWDVIEGQGSLFHVAFAGVTLGLVHGSQPDALVMCHEPTRSHMRNLPGRPLPDLAECIDAHVRAARLVRPSARCVAVSLNTSALDEDRAAVIKRAIEAETGLPCVDPAVDGCGRIVEALA